jgi:hypothetical protein
MFDKKYPIYERQLAKLKWEETFLD